MRVLDHEPPARGPSEGITLVRHVPIGPYVTRAARMRLGHGGVLDDQAQSLSGRVWSRCAASTTSCSSTGSLKGSSSSRETRLSSFCQRRSSCTYGSYGTRVS